MWTYKDERRRMKMHKSYESLLKHPENLGKFFSTSWSPENILLVTIIHILQKVAQVNEKSTCEPTKMREDV